MEPITRVKFKITLRSDTPKEVIGLLERVITRGDLGLGDKTFFDFDDVFKPDMVHPFFKCRRWYSFFLGNNFDSSIQSSIIYTGKYWDLNINSEFKNYGAEIGNFLDWIEPYIAGHKAHQYLGKYKGEDSPVARVHRDSIKDMWKGDM